MTVLTWCYWKGEWFPSMSKKSLPFTCQTTELFFSGLMEKIKHNRAVLRGCTHWHRCIQYICVCL